MSERSVILDGVLVILEGGESDTERLDLDVASPPVRLDRGEERYEPVLSHFDEHLRDIGGCWRHRLRTSWQEMPRGYEAPRVKP